MRRKQKPGKKTKKLEKSRRWMSIGSQLKNFAIVSGPTSTTDSPPKPPTKGTWRRETISFPKKKRRLLGFASSRKSPTGSPSCFGWVLSCASSLTSSNLLGISRTWSWGSYWSLWYSLQASLPSCRLLNQKHWWRASRICCLQFARLFEMEKLLNYPHKNWLEEISLM